MRACGCWFWIIKQQPKNEVNNKKQEEETLATKEKQNAADC